MKNNVMKNVVRLAAFLFVGILALSLMGVSFAAIVPGLMLGATTAAVAETGTTETADEQSSDLLDHQLSQKITEISSSRYPLDTIMRKVGMSTPSPSWKYEWYNVDEKGFVDTLGAAFDTSAASTFSSGSNASYDIHTLTVSNIGYWSKDDVAWFPSVTSTNGGTLRVHVVSINRSASTLGVIVLNSNASDVSDDMPDIDNGTEIVCIGNAKAELDAQTTPYTIYPEKVYNYNQIHMAQVEESVIAELHNKEVNWGLADNRLLSLEHMRKQMELTNLFGKRAMKVDPEDGDQKYFAGGIIDYVSNTIEYNEGALTDYALTEWAEDVFTDNAGSDTRYLFAGNTLITELANADDLVKKQLERGNVEVKFGLRFKAIETNFGLIYIYHHPLLDTITLWKKRGLILDLTKLERPTFEKLQTMQLDLDKSGTRRVKAYRIHETSCLATRYPGVHTIVQPASSS